jgi:hypothetical protein
MSYLDRMVLYMNHATTFGSWYTKIIIGIKKQMRYF